MSRKPRIRIPVHVAVYSIGFAPCCAYAYYWYKNSPTEEEFEKELRKNYSHNIEGSRDKHAQMSSFLQKVKDQDSDQEKQMSKILLGGRGQQKRLYAVDEKIYGTEEGAKLQAEAMEKAAAKNRKKRRKKKKSSDDSTKSKDGDLEKSSELSNVQESSRVKQSVAAMAVVGTLAAGASFFLGGRRQ